MHTLRGHCRMGKMSGGGSHVEVHECIWSHPRSNRILEVNFSSLLLLICFLQNVPNRTAAIGLASLTIFGFRGGRVCGEFQQIVSP